MARIPVSDVTFQFCKHRVFDNKMQPRVITALVTPFDLKYNVDFQSLENLISYQIEAKIDGILFCGTTGEGSLLTFKEKLAIFEKGVKRAKGFTEIIANVGTCSTQKSVDLAKEAKNLGVDSFVAIVPYYIKPSLQGCIQHFKAIAGVGLPLIVYHHPGRTGVRLSQKALMEIAAINGVVGIKDCSGDMDLVEQLAKAGIVVYSGDDLLCISQLEKGAYGSISVTANVVADLWKEAIETQKISGELECLVKTLLLESNPQCVKYASSVLGFCLSKLRLPLVEPSKINQKAIRKSLHSVGLAFR